LYKIDGQEIYFNGVATDGISGAVGNYRLLDLDGDGNPDSYYAGSPLPLAHGGWVNELMWKNFDLNFPRIRLFKTVPVSCHIEFHPPAHSTLPQDICLQLQLKPLVGNFHRIFHLRTERIQTARNRNIIISELYICNSNPISYSNDN